MASEGILFSDYYAAAPICSASRAGLLTGCYPRRVGNHIWVHRADSDYGIHPDELTIAELFKQSGYQTACIGKWHLGFQEPFLPHNQGFDHYYGLLHNLDPWKLFISKSRAAFPSFVTEKKLNGLPTPQNSLAFIQMKPLTSSKKQIKTILSISSPYHAPRSARS